jgi:hypothetical protein
MSTLGNIDQVQKAPPRRLAHQWNTKPCPVIRLNLQTPEINWLTGQVLRLPRLPLIEISVCQRVSRLEADFNWQAANSFVAN